MGDICGIFPLAVAIKVGNIEILKINSFFVPRRDYLET